MERRACKQATGCRTRHVSLPHTMGSTRAGGDLGRRVQSASRALHARGGTSPLAAASQQRTGLQAPTVCATHTRSERHGPGLRCWRCGHAKRTHHHRQLDTGRWQLRVAALARSSELVGKLLHVAPRMSRPPPATWPTSWRLRVRFNGPTPTTAPEGDRSASDTTRSTRHASPQGRGGRRSTRHLRRKHGAHGHSSSTIEAAAYGCNTSRVATLTASWQTGSHERARTDTANIQRPSDDSIDKNTTPALRRGMPAPLKGAGRGWGWGPNRP